LHEPPTQQPIRVTVVEAEACHFCEAARETITQVAVDTPLDVTYLSSRSERGLALIRQHRAALAPLVLIEDHFVSNGRLSKNLFRKRISEVLATQAIA
jgi:glutaredoxin